MDPVIYTDRHDVYGNQWLEHRRCFTTNPCLYRRSLCAAGWPDELDSEGLMTQRLNGDPANRFGYWGPRDDSPWVHHIGSHRVGTGYW
jgi:hypothetical protein